ncbi:MAG: cell division protein ZapB [Spirochaetaceae bacterium]|jgi:FtsZ-binding cell division protein ZapB|nr:cell division protein ZapB [Spirochaetaceae bacterium]
MVTVEQVRQLESKVAKAIDYINKLTDENILLKNKLDSYQTRIDELEVLIQRFKEDQARIEEGILSALGRLNQFEDDVHKTITPVNAGGVSPCQTQASVQEKPEPTGTEDGGETMPSPSPAQAPSERFEGDDSAVDAAEETLTAETASTSELDIF